MFSSIKSCLTWFSRTLSNASHVSSFSDIIHLVIKFFLGFRNFRKVKLDPKFSWYLLAYSNLYFPNSCSKPRMLVWSEQNHSANHWSEVNVNLPSLFHQCPVKGCFPFWPQVFVKNYIIYNFQTNTFYHT